ncbi:hypothetical protein [Tersicoccus sp. Bi-70]|uniref:hypothetical protein n=1 Tax=Tersicoccus sp. Bi-70 TaxID=1897634 RepID=UPI000975B1B1|nr:hypothetical protein [Tersicoccus sp. Bi-70]OMH32318.1 hypothetical protein BGP79_07710 [Tersicoccus sp. Bi-70]
MVGIVAVGGTYDVAAGLPFQSHLRVYEPLRAFEPHGLIGDAEDPAAADRQEMLASLARACEPRYQPFPVGPEHVRALDVTDEAGTTRTLFNPGQLGVRALLAAEKLSNAVSTDLAELVVPGEALERHLDDLRTSDGTDRLHTRTATWGVPLAWFALFSDEDPVQVFRSGGRIRNCRLCAGIGEARERLQFAATSLAAVVPEMDLLTELADLSEWLDGFDDGAAIALDYGQVAESVYPDDSPSDLRLGIECLAEADMTGAAAAYRRLAGRWLPIKQLARAS